MNEPDFHKVYEYDTKEYWEEVLKCKTVDHLFKAGELWKNRYRFKLKKGKEIFTDIDLKTRSRGGDNYCISKLVGATKGIKVVKRYVSPKTKIELIEDK